MSNTNEQLLAALKDAIFQLEGYMVAFGSNSATRNKIREYKELIEQVEAKQTA